jgi:hypothetical protein
MTDRPRPAGTLPIKKIPPSTPYPENRSDGP